MTLNLTPAPPLPTKNDPATFYDRADALFQWLTGTHISELEGIQASDYFSVQTSFTDVRPDRLLKVGAFGLGEGVNTKLTDVDLNTTSGFYFGYGGAHAAAAGGDNPFPTLNGAFGLVQGVSHIGAADEYMWQIAVAISGALTSRDAVYRKRSTAANGWTPWAVLYSTANVVGAVSQSGGSPTGAVIERGSNANGEYVRFADGTQICTHRLTCGFNSVTSLRAVWTYPAAFAALPSVSLASLTGSAVLAAATIRDLHEARAGYASVTSTAINVYTVPGALDLASGDSIDVAATAIGRWV